jgi:hypothetical protein
MLLDSTLAIIPHSERGYPKQQTSATGSVPPWLAEPAEQD